MLYSGRKRRTQMVKAFDTTEERFISRRVLGLQEIPLDKVVGSVGRYQFLRDDFMPLDGRPDGRHFSIRKLVEAGYPLPPIEVYKVRDEYYVLDGNHRVAICKAMGVTDIDADVIEYIPKPDTEENRLYHEQQDFAKRTGLDKIELTEPQFGKLLSMIDEQCQQCNSCKGSGSCKNLKKVALDWYRKVYLPVIDDPRVICALKSFPDRTLGDLFVYICDHKWIRSRDEDYDIGFEQAIEEFVAYTSSSRGLFALLSRIAHALPLRLPYWLVADGSDEPDEPRLPDAPVQESPPVEEFLPAEPMTGFYSNMPSAYYNSIRQNR